MQPKQRSVEEYLTANGKSPYYTWLRTLDGSVRGRITVRIRRIEEEGNYGDCAPVGNGVFELRLDIGPGYRIYFGVDGDIVVLLTGGDKRTQVTDIKKAKTYWSDYNA